MNQPHNGAITKGGVIAPWPIVAAADIAISAAETRRLQDFAERLAAAEPTLRADWFREHGVAPGWAPGPNVYLEDHRGIELATETGAKPFEYRSLCLAGDDDYFLATEPRRRNYESYLRETVGLGSPTILAAPMTRVIRTRRLGKACLGEPAIMDILINAAVEHSGLNIIPFLSTGDVWGLGREIARRSGQPVRIAAPPPQLASRANDKLWFAALLRNLLGRRALPATFEAHSYAAAAAKIRRLAHTAKQIVVKAPASAGAAGNIVFPRSVFEGLTLSEIRRSLVENFSAIGWRGGFPLLLGEWEQSVIASPSVQIWIPLLEHGPPIIEGVFVQTVSADGGKFIGAEPADLLAATTAKIHMEALQIAYLLQRLGYVGRLSLDTVVVGASMKSAEIHWIEANARWGGVSIPMTLANRINEGVSKKDLLIVQKAAETICVADINEVLKALGSKLVSLVEKRRRGVIFLLPPESGHLMFSVIGLPLQEARAIAAQSIAACLAGADE